MKLDEVKLAIATGKLRLGWWDGARHYLKVWFSAVLLSVLGWKLIDSVFPPIGSLFFPLPVFAAAGLSYYLRRQLRFATIDTSLSKAAIFKVLGRVIDHEGWRVKKRTKRLLICRSQDSYVITVIVDGGKVRIASYTDPEVLMSWAYFVHNEVNVDKVIGQIERAAYDPNLTALG